MKNVPITLTLSENVVRDLHLYISRKGISKFVTKAVEESLKTAKQKLAREFREASEDKERNSEIELWYPLGDEGPPI